MLNVQWEKFDYANPPPDGLYWVVVNTRVADVDVGAGGQIVGQYTDEVDTEVAMVFVDVNADKEVCFDPMNEYEFGKVPDDGWVSHYAKVEKPCLPVFTAETATSAVTV